MSIFSVKTMSEFAHSRASAITQFPDFDLVTRSVDRVERLSKSGNFLTREVGARLAMIPVASSLIVDSVARTVLSSAILIPQTFIYQATQSLPFPLGTLRAFVFLPGSRELFNIYTKVVINKVSLLLSFTAGVVSTQWTVEALRNLGSAKRQNIQSVWQQSKNWLDDFFVQLKSRMGMGAKKEPLLNRVLHSFTGKNADLLGLTFVALSSMALAVAVINNPSIDSSSINSTALENLLLPPKYSMRF